MPLSSALSAQRGGAWLVAPADSAATFTPELKTHEHRLIGQTAGAFVEQEVLPVLDQLERRDWDLSRRLMKRCGELELFAVDLPEADGGVGLDKVSSLIVSEMFARAASFGATFGAQANLTILPLFMFGTEDQKRRYLPKLIPGELLGAYALSESGSGSDALGAKTRAVRQADGSFVLNGEKMWITNGGVADVFIVFAKVDGEQFTAFIVERAFGGLTNGREEDKMGLHGSSTTAVVLQDVRVPAYNVLGEIGKGHKVAFNVLNFGRLKLGGGCNGAACIAIAETVRYAAERRQFGQPIANFGAIRHKIGEMIVRTYASESLAYRTAGLIDAYVDAASSGDSTKPHPDPATTLAALEEYAIEASIAKVAGSEMLNFVLDENVQVHGGNGFVKDYPAERHLRDARVNRIFEGTNEINRLLIPGMLAKRAGKGDLPIFAAAKALQDELLGPSSLQSGDDSPLGTARTAVEAFRKTALMVFGLALQTYGHTISDQQEVLMLVADVMIDLYSAESAVLRAERALNRHDPRSSLHVDAAALFVNDAAMRIESATRQALAAMAEGDTLRTTLSALRRLLKVSPINGVALRRRLAAEAVSRGGYIF